MEYQPPELPKWLTRRQVAAMLQIKPRTVSDMVDRGEFPAPLWLTSRLIRWDGEHLAKFIAEQSQPRGKQ